MLKVNNLVSQFLVAVGLVAVVGCAGADSDGFDEFDTEASLTEDISAEEAIAADDELLEKGFRVAEPEALGKGGTFVLRSLHGGNLYLCNDDGNVVIRKGINFTDCSFQIYGKLHDARIWYKEGRLRGSGNRDGANVIVGDGTSFSKFRITRTTRKQRDGINTYFLFGQNTARVIDIERRRTTSGSNVHMWSLHGDTNQEWVFFKLQ